jgi:hypothetical protein
MMSRRPNPEFRSLYTRVAFAPGWFTAILLTFSLESLGAENLILHLKNGDRLAGMVMAEDTNRIVFATSWATNLVIPLNEISSREHLPGTNAPALASVTGVTNTTPAPVGALVPSTNTPGTFASATNGPARNLGAGATPATNAPAKPAAPATAAAKPPKPKQWKIEARVGADFLFGAKDQQIYYGRFKLSYDHPYEANPKQFFRNILDYSVDYGRTEGVLSANRMNASDKTDFDVGTRKFYVYNLAAIGYDEIRRIDKQWEAGPGLGYHLLTQPTLVANLEAGLNYWAQYRSDNTKTEKLYFRFAEDSTWKLHKRLTFTEKFEFFPRVEDLDQYRFRFESTLSYAVWQNVSLNVTLLDLYDTSPAKTVPNNDLQIRSSLGITF